MTVSCVCKDNMSFTRNALTANRLIESLTILEESTNHQQHVGCSQSSLIKRGFSQVHDFTYCCRCRWCALLLKKMKKITDNNIRNKTKQQTTNKHSGFKSVLGGLQHAEACLIRAASPDFCGWGEANLTRLELLAEQPG